MITNELLAHNLGSVNTLLQFYNSDIEQYNFIILILNRLNYPK